MEEGSLDELHNYSAQYERCQDMLDSDHCGHMESIVQSATVTYAFTGCDTQRYTLTQSVPKQMSSIQGDDDILPPDQTKTYCEEGTPVSLSRVASQSCLPLLLQTTEEPETGPTQKSPSEITNRNISSGTSTLFRDRDSRWSQRAETQKQDTVSTGKTHQQHQRENTPLMFSPLSSPSSLISAEAYSCHSSVASDYSHQPCSSVSTGELPDSPGELMLASQSRIQYSTTKLLNPVVIGSGQAACCAQSANGDEYCNKQRSVENILDIRSASSVDIPHSISLQNSNTVDTTFISSESEVLVTHAAADIQPASVQAQTRCVQTVVRKATEDMQLPWPIKAIAERETVRTEFDPAEMSLCDRTEKMFTPDAEDLFASEVSGDEADILAQCIRTGMPAPSRCSAKLRRTVSDNTTAKHHELPEPTPSSSASYQPNSVTSHSDCKLVPGSPKPHMTLVTRSGLGKEGAIWTGFQGSSRPVEDAAKLSKSTQIQPQQTTVIIHQTDFCQNSLDNYTSDAPKTFNTEDTPLNFSPNPSVCSLSDASETAVVNQFSHSCKADEKSENFLPEDVKKQVPSNSIQSIIPSSCTPRLEFNRNTREENGTSPADTFFQRNMPVKSKQVKQLSDLKHPFVGPAADLTKIFTTEDTPNSMSTTSSLSDLTVDFGSDTLKGEGRQAGESHIRRLFGQRNRDFASYEDCFCFCKGCDSANEGCDSPHVYFTEGTPKTSSHCDSPCSAEVHDEDGISHEEEKQLTSYSQTSQCGARHQSNQKSDASAGKTGKQYFGCEEEFEVKDEFEVQDSHIIISHRTLQSSFAHEPCPPEQHQTFCVSCSDSLSTELSSADLTPTEQALLNECISAAMPRRCPSHGVRKSHRNSRTKLKVGSSGREHV